MSSSTLHSPTSPPFLWSPDPSSSPPLASSSDLSVSGPDRRQNPPRNSHSQSQASSFDRPLQPPRLSSPRIFRDFFSAMSNDATRRQAVLPPANFQDSVQDVSRALRSANRALQNAQEAFRSRTMSSRSDVVDLTNSPPEISPESQFISRTTHPHDSSYPHRRRVNTLNEPVYGHPLDFPATSTATSTNTNPMDEYHRARVTNLLAVARRERERETSQQEEQAIRRQRENHATWRRNQAQVRDRQTQHTQQQERHQHLPTMPPPPLSPPLLRRVSSSFSSRPRHQQADSRPSSSSPEPSEPDAVDLTAVEDNKTLAQALSKQRQDAVSSQKAYTFDGDGGRTILTGYKCPICMDTPKDATSTICGHLFCHHCIIDTLKWSAEQRRDEHPTARRILGVCPVCRKQLNGKDTAVTGRQLVPLELKIMTKKRKRTDKGKQKEEQQVIKNEDLDNGNGSSEKENRRTSKARKRQSTEEAMREFIVERDVDTPVEDSTRFRTR